MVSNYFALRGLEALQAQSNQERKIVCSIPIPAHIIDRLAELAEQHTHLAGNIKEREDSLRYRFQQATFDQMNAPAGSTGGLFGNGALGYAASGLAAAGRYMFYNEALSDKRQNLLDPSEAAYTALVNEVKREERDSQPKLSAQLSQVLQEKWIVVKETLKGFRQSARDQIKQIMAPFNAIEAAGVKSLLHRVAVAVEGRRHGAGESGIARRFEMKLQEARASGNVTGSTTLTEEMRQQACAILHSDKSPGAVKSATTILDDAISHMREVLAHAKAVNAGKEPNAITATSQLGVLLQTRALATGNNANFKEGLSLFVALAHEDFAYAKSYLGSELSRNPWLVNNLGIDEKLARTCIEFSALHGDIHSQLRLASMIASEKPDEGSYERPQMRGA